jgi:hypothetical protein
MNTISQFGIFILVLTCMQTGVVLSETDCPVKDTARGVVVKIEEEIEDFSKSRQIIGSGVILKSINQKYYILTNQHVVENIKDKAEYKAIIDSVNLKSSSTNDQLNSIEQLENLQQIPLTITKVGSDEPDPNNRDKDFALLEFKSNKLYNSAILPSANTEVQEGNTVYATGFPDTTKKFRCVPLTIIPTTIKFKVLTYEPKGSINVDTGMSGGAITNYPLNQLLGIHKGALSGDANNQSKEGIGIPLSVIETEKEFLPYFQEIRKAMEGGAEITSPNPINPGVSNIQNPGNKPFQGLFNKPIDGGYW